MMNPSPLSFGVLLLFLLEIRMRRTSLRSSFPLYYIGLIVVGSSLLYAVYTRDIGTPFKDSLTDEQKKIRDEEKEKRGRIFWTSALITAMAHFSIFGLRKM